MAQLTAETSANPFAVDPSDELPVGLQLTLRLRALIATGRLPAGERLPSVRRLAGWAGVNLNTVRAVYAALETAGLVVSHQGRGTFVAEEVRTAPELEEIAAEAIRKAAAAGLDARELAEVTLVCAAIPGEELGAAAPAPGTLDPAEAEAIGVRRELRRQIGVLERDLAEYARHIPADMTTAPRVTSGHVAGVEELEQTRDTLVAQLSQARGAAERRAREEARRQAGAAAPGAEEAGPLARAMGWWRAKRQGRVGGRAVPLFEQVGSMVVLTGRTLWAAARAPYPYGDELVEQFAFTLRLCWLPLLISTFALNLGAPGLQAAGPLHVFGALDRLGGFFVLTAIRWIGPLVTAVVVAGVAGTAITADLGARRIREELDALQVLGVDPVKNLVVPRFLALVVVTGLLDVVAIVFGLLAGIVAELIYHQTLGGFFATLFSQASVTDVWASVLMCSIFGAIVAVVCCFKGMTASGGAAGVGRAVNQAVVISLIGVFAFNYVFTAILLATNPELQTIR